jgi:hypothetical protein
MPRRFSLPDLHYEAAQVKRKILNDVRHGRLRKLNKQEIFGLIASRPRINLKSDRVLWEGEPRIYLDAWYTKVVDEVAHILGNIKATTGGELAEGTPARSGISLAEQIQELELKVKEQHALIQSQQRMLDTLRVENEKLRLQLLTRHSKIDV